MRFTEIDQLIPQQLDFVPRERRNEVRMLLIAFTFTIGLVFISGYAPLFQHMEVYTPLIAILLIAVLCMHVLYRYQRGLDTVMSTEYQNLLFSQILSLGCSFCIITRRDGSIVYASGDTNNVFPDFEHAQAQALDAVFERGAVRTVDRERVMAAIHSGTADHLIFPIYDRYNQKKDYIVTVESLPRPAGYSVVRGREYLGQRSGSEMMPDLLRSTSVDKLDHMLATTDVAHYTTDALGQIEYANPAFEHLFGYEAGEVPESHLRLHHLIFSLGDHAMTEETPLRDYSGRAMLVDRRGRQIPAFVSQKLLLDGTGKLVGATGTVLPTSADA